jgi:hypothetical protein
MPFPCPACTTYSKVTNTVHLARNLARYYRCPACGARFSTRELLQDNLERLVTAIQGKTLLEPSNAPEATVLQNDNTLLEPSNAPPERLEPPEVFEDGPEFEDDWSSP